MSSRTDSERELSVHIFSVSAQLVGISLTVLGLFRVLVRLRASGRFGDGLLAIDAIVYLSACIFAYAILHSRTQERRRVLERIADVCFIGGLVLMTGVCTLVAWQMV
jgi:hypothetical protein